ncbi:hypothetical protein PoHVEF18_000345 [Penicillium ochrochloron]
MVKAILTKGDKVIATARASQGISGSERFSALREAGAAVLELDVTSPQEQLDEIAKTAWGVYGNINVLVNNAGYIENGILEEMRSFLPMMRARKTGTLLFVGSVSVYYTMPSTSSYIGSKALLEGPATNLAVEVAPFGLRTSILTFGHFRTDILCSSNLHSRAPNKLSDYVKANNEGRGKMCGKGLPLRLPIGSDTFGIMREDLQKRLQVYDEWEDIMSKTDCE